MQPIDFEESNKTLLKPEDMTDEECGPLPVWTDNKYCYSCWRPSLRERLSMLFFGRVWVSVHSEATQPPMGIWAERDPFTVQE